MQPGRGRDLAKGAAEEEEEEGAACPMDPLGPPGNPCPGQSPPEPAGKEGRDRGAF